MDRTLVRARRRLRSSGPLWLGGLCSLVLFLFAVRLLGTATGAAVGPLETLFDQYVGSDGRALGWSWLATYALANGSVVAALAVSLFDVGVVSAGQLFLLVAGSRLGGAAIVVLIGALDYLQKRRYSIGEATSLGLLTFLLTHSIYLPATVLGYVLVPRLQDRFGGFEGQFVPSLSPFAAIDSLTIAIVERVGPEVGVVAALSIFLVSLRLFDRVLERVDTGWLRDRFFRQFRREWVSFGLGVVVTGMTTSVAFSLGVIVPLYNRGYIERREVVPYVLGANLGTLVDTIAIAVILEAPDAIGIVVVLLGLGTALTLVALVMFAVYLPLIETAHSRLVDDRRSFVVFLATLLVVPVLLVVLPV